VEYGTPAELMKRQANKKKREREIEREREREREKEIERKKDIKKERKRKRTRRTRRCLLGRVQSFARTTPIILWESEPSLLIPNQ